MKIFKKFLAAIIAMVMAFAVFAFAACKTDDNDNGGTNGGNEGTEGGNGGTNTKTPAQQLLEAVDKSTSYVEISAEYSYVSRYENYTLSSLDEEKPAETTVRNTTDTQSISGHVDIEKGNGDITTVYSEENTRGGEVETYGGTSYMFLRGWHAFGGAPEDEEEVTDYSKLSLQYLGNLNEQLGSAIAGITGGSQGNPDGNRPAALAEAPGLDAGALALPAVIKANSVLVNLAVAADTLEVKDGVYTVDVIKTLNKVYTEISAVVNALDENTTVGEVLSNKTVEKYLSAITAVVPAETVYSLVCSALDEMSPAMKEMLSFIPGIKPDENSTTYDYIVKLVSSDEVKTLVNGLLEKQGAPAEALFTTTLDKAKLNDVLALAEMSVAGVKEMVKNLPVEFADGKLTITSKGERSESVTVYKELSLGYTVKDGTLTGQTVSAKFDNEGKEHRSMSFNPEGGEQVTIYDIDEYSDIVTMTTSLTYVNSAAALVDISGCTVEKSEEWRGFVDGDTTSSPVRIYPHEHIDQDLYYYNGQSIDLTVAIKVEDGEVVGLKVNDQLLDEDGTYRINDVEVQEYVEDGPSVTTNITIIFDITYEVTESYVNIYVNDNYRGYVSKKRGETYYSTTVSKILSGTPDWTELAD